MVVKPCLLLEPLHAAGLGARVWLFLGVYVNVLLKVLILGKFPPTYLAHKPFEPKVGDNEVSAETLLGGKGLATVFEGASLDALSFGGLHHLLEVLGHELLVHVRQLFS